MNSRNAVLAATMAVGWVLQAGAQATDGQAAATVTVVSTPLPFRQFDKVEITGSAILAKQARDELPVQVFSRREIAQSGALDLGSFLQKLPVMQSFVDGSVVAGTINGGPDTAAIHGNQRGTLVLLDGRRLPYYGSQSIMGERAVVDLNFIPLAAVERIEVLTDGASARYGSDAIAGVVNVITRGQLRGLSLSAQTVVPEARGGTQRQVDLGWGWGSMDRDGQSLRLYGTLSHQDAVLAGWRDATREGAKAFDVNGQRYWAISNNLSWSSAPGRNYYTSAGALRNAYYDANGVCEPGWYELETGVCLRNAQPAVSLYPQVDKQQLFVQYERVLPNGWQLFGDALWTRQVQEMFPSGGFYNFLQSDGAGRSYLMDGVLWGPLQQRYTNTMHHAVLGLRGEVADWDVTANVSNGEHHVDRRYTGGLVKAGYDLVQLAPGEIGLDPSQYAQATRDLFAQYAGSNERILDVGSMQLSTLGLLASKTVGDSDAGPIKLGMGLDGRHEQVSYAPDAAADSTTRPAWDASRRLLAVYSELQWPLTQSLETTWSLRHDRYSDFGNVTTGKLGWRLRAAESTWLRGSVGTGFRAPTLGQLVPKQTSYGRYDGLPVLSQGNPDLRPEKSLQWTLGVQLEPSRNWSLGADVWNVHIHDTFGVLSPETISASAQLSEKYKTDSAWLTPNMNLGQATAQGVDYYMRWRQPVDYGRWQVALGGTWMLKSERDIGTGPVSNLARYSSESSTYAPRHQLVLSAALEQKRWTYSAALRYRSGHCETVDMYDAAGQTQHVTRKLRGTPTLDLMLQGKLSPNMDLTAAVLNVTDRYPDFTALSTSAILGADAMPADYYGRRLQLKMQYRF